MRNTLKRVLSTALAGLMLTSVATVAVSANSGEKSLITFKEACEKQWNEQVGEIETVEYMFYMPDDMKNKYNDYYDGSDPSTYAAGVYWWEGTAKPGDCLWLDKDWPGYAVTRKAADCDNVYIAEVPADVPTVVWNNSVDGGTDNTQPYYSLAMQSADAGVTGYGPGMDTYGFYPNGLESMVGMIYVCNPADTTVSPASQKLAFKGEWFYYYGNGEYGFAPTREAAGANVYKDGVFPPTGLTISTTKINAGVGGEVTCTANKTGTTAKSENEAVATVAERDGKFVVTGVAKGTTKIIFEYFNEETQETNKVEVPVNVTVPSFDETNIKMNLNSSYDNIGYGLGENCVITYSTKGIVEYDGYVVTSKKSGTVTVNCTQGGKTYSFKVTVATPKLKKANINLAAGKTEKIKVTGVDGTAKYSVDKKNVATVDKNGKVSALKRGNATVTVKIAGKTYKCKVKVTSNPSLAKKSASTKIKKSTTVKIKGAVSKANVKVAKCKVAKITASKDKLTIKGTKKGTQTVNVTVNGVKLKLKVSVK